MCLAQGVWIARNKLCFEQKETPQEMILLKSVSALESFKKVRRNHGGRALAEAKENRRDGKGWKPPQEGHYKLNTDATEVGENR